MVHVGPTIAGPVSSQAPKRPTIRSLFRTDAGRIAAKLKSAYKQS